jgi:hypothetical protein
MSDTSTPPLRQIGRRKNLPGIGFTTGEWRGVGSLARAKTNRILPGAAPRLRKNSKAAR